MAGRGKPKDPNHIPYAVQFEAFDRIGLDALLDKYLEVRSVRDMLVAVGMDRKAGGALYAWLHKQDKMTEEELEAAGFSETRWVRWSAARRAIGLAYADAAIDTVEDATAQTIAVDREKAGTYRWAAEQFARQDFGKESRVKHEVSGRLDVVGEWALVLRHGVELEELEEADVELLEPGDD